MNETKWILQHAKIERSTWGDDKGKYKGDVKFVNGLKQEFQMEITEETMNEILKLIFPDVAVMAMDFANELMESLKKQSESI